jgi:hypothetical protein
MKHPTRPPNRGGFATTFALFLVILVSAALLAATNLTIADARRTTNEAVEAQMRQLVHAGAAVQSSTTESQTDETTIELSLPEELKEQGGQVRVHRRPRRNAPEFELQIEVRIAGARSSQIVRDKRVP